MNYLCTHVSKVFCGTISALNEAAVIDILNKIEGQVAKVANHNY